MYIEHEVSSHRRFCMFGVTIACMFREVCMQGMIKESLRLTNSTEFYILEESGQQSASMTNSRARLGRQYFIPHPLLSESIQIHYRMSLFQTTSRSGVYSFLPDNQSYCLTLSSIITLTSSFYFIHVLCFNSAEPTPNIDHTHTAHAVKLIHNSSPMMPMFQALPTPSLSPATKISKTGMEYPFSVVHRYWTMTT